MKCPQCGQEDWVTGGISELPGNPLYFKPSKTKLLVPSYPALQSQACKVCGHVALAVDVEKLKGTLKEE